MKNCVSILLLSRGVPMLLGGDEIQRTQGGNNNPYNQDNPTSWFDWTAADWKTAMRRYFQRMIAFRKAHRALWQPRFYTGATNERGPADIAWHGTTLGSPGCDDPEGRALACTIAGLNSDADLHVMMNMFWEPLDFEVPVDPPRVWHVAVDTAAQSPDNIADQNRAAPLRGSQCAVQGRSIVVLVATPA